MANRYALIGEKLTHSLSPGIHERILESMGLEGSYELVEIERNRLKAGIEGLSASGFAGFNVTIPYKEAVLPFMDELSEEAAAIGAVNTVKIEGNRMKGFNTDLYGFEAMMEAGGMRLAPHARCLVIGTGGAARMAAYWLKQRTPHVWFLSRNPELSMEKLGVEQVIGKEAVSILETVDFAVNCSPCGMFPEIGKMPLDTKVLKRLSMAADLVYNPMRTLFMQDRQKAKNRVAGGLRMLVAQACRAQEIWNGRAVGADAERRLQEAFGMDHINPVLIGMPGSGKSSVGRELASRMNRKLVDTDLLIEERHGPITRIFEKEGEEAFRAKERAVIRSLRNEKGLVIATGGGAVLDADNVADLKFNGILVHLDRSLEAIEATLEKEQRPLLKQAGALKRLYETRRERYLEAADLHVYDARNPEEQARLILGLISQKSF